MKKVIFIALTCFGIQSSSQAQTIPNGGFENWSMPNGYNVPDSWSTLNDLTAPLSVYTCTKGTPGSPGASYLKLTSKSVAGIGVVPGIAVSGSLNSGSFSALGGFPFAFHPTFFTGKWQFMGASSNDVGSVVVALTHFDAAAGTRDTVALASHSLVGMEMSWVNFSLPFTYLNANTADSCIIMLNASGSNPQASSYLYVDNLAFTIPIDINELHAKNELEVFPNPAQRVLNIKGNFDASTVMEYRVFNALGKMVLYNRSAFGKNIQVDISDLSAGSYYVQVSMNGATSVLKFIKQ